MGRFVLPVVDEFSQSSNHHTYTDLVWHFGDVAYSVGYIAQVSNL